MYERDEFWITVSMAVSIWPQAGADDRLRLE